MSSSVERNNLIELAVMYLVIIALSFLGIIWDIWSGLLLSGLDGIFLLLICLSMGGIFTLELFVTLTKLGVLKPPRLFAGKPAASAAANPGSKPEGK